MITEDNSNNFDNVEEIMLILQSFISSVSAKSYFSRYFVLHVAHKVSYTNDFQRVQLLDAQL